MAHVNMEFFSWLVNTGLIQGDPNYYSSGSAQPFEYENAIRVAINNLETASDPRVAAAFWSFLVEMGAVEGDPAYYSDGLAQPSEVENAIKVSSQFLTSNPDAGGVTGGGGTGGGGGGTITEGGITDIPPVDIDGTTIPDGGRLVRVTNPEGSDASELFFVVYDWRGVELVYEVGDRARAVHFT